MSRVLEFREMPYREEWRWAWKQFFRPHRAYTHCVWAMRGIALVTVYVLVMFALGFAGFIEGLALGTWLGLILQMRNNIRQTTQWRLARINSRRLMQNRRRGDRGKEARNG